MKYRCQMMREVFQYCEVVVEAASLEEAEEKALVEAHENGAWELSDNDYADEVCFLENENGDPDIEEITR